MNFPFPYTWIIAGAAQVGGNDANTVLLLHCNGANGSTYFPDASVSGHLMARVGALVGTAQSKFGGASAQFSGTSYMHHYDSATTDFTFGTGDFTIDFWIRFDAVATVQLVADWRYNSAGSYPRIYLLNTAKLLYDVGDLARITGTTTIVAGTWYHVAVARSGANTKMFLNGVQEGGTYTDTNNYGIGAASRPLWGVNGADAASNPLQGWMDEIRVTKGLARWTANFTPPVAAYPGRTGENDSFTKLLLHCAPDTTQSIDSSASGHHLNSQAMSISTSVTKFGSGSLSFAAASFAYIWLDSADPLAGDFTFGTGDFTIDMWVNVGDYTNWHYIYEGRPVGGDGAYPLLYFASATGALTYWVNNAAAIVGTFLPLNSWHHVALVRSSGVTKLYIDGAQTGSSFTDSTNYLSGGSYKPYIGTNYATNGFFNGYMDEFRISKGIARWTSNFTPPTAPYA